MERKLKKGFQQFMAEAASQVDAIEVSKVVRLTSNPGVQFIDVRERHELIAGGKIAGAEHASRGMLEFLVDPASPYYDETFGQDKKFVVYCASGGRSSLAAHRMKEMGIDNVCTLAGGFKAWIAADGEVEKVAE